MKTEERIRHVYKIFDKLNEDNFYIGTTFDIDRRWNQHKRNSNSKKLAADMLEYGIQDFDIEILFSGLEIEAYEKEIKLIAELKPYYNNIGDIGGKFGNDKETKMNDELVKELRDMWHTGKYKQKYLSEVFDISISHLSAIVIGNYWKEAEGKISEPNKSPNKGISINVGSKNGRAKWNEKDIKIIRLLFHNKTYSKKELINIYHMSQANIDDILTGRTWDKAGGPIQKARPRLTKLKVEKIRQLFDSKEYTRKALSKMFSISKESINNTLTGKTWNKVPGPIKSMKEITNIENERK